MKIAENICFEDAIYEFSPPFRCNIYWRTNSHHKQTSPTFSLSSPNDFSKDYDDEETFPNTSPAPKEYTAVEKVWLWAVVVFSGVQCVSVIRKTSN